jgi:transketolase C-terminal domain/subunit
LEANFDSVKNFKRIGIPDVFSDGYGSQDDLMKKYGITADHVCSVIKKFKNLKVKVAV